MKGLLLKDFYTLGRQMKLYLVLIIVFAAIPGFSSTALAMVYASMLPMTALSYDEHARWDELAATMPYSPISLVLSKYLLGYAAVAVAALLSFAGQSVAALVRGEAFAAAEATESLLVALLVLTVQAVTLPLLFRLGVEKGRLVFLVVLAAITGAGVGLSAFISHNADVGARFMTTALWIAIPVAIAVNALSIPLSMRMYKARRR